MLVFAACARQDPQTEQGEGQTETESGTTTFEDSSDSGTSDDSDDTGDGCPAPDPGSASYFFNFGHPDWPYAAYVDGQSPPTEFGICTVTAVDTSPHERLGDFIEVSFECLHEDGNHYPQAMVILSTPIHQAALATWQSVEPLDIRFLDSSTWDEHLRFRYLSIRDAEGELLFAGVHSNPSPGVGQDGEALGAPPEQDFASWYAPFSGFTLRDLGCDPVEVDRVDYLGFADVVRRLGVDFEVEDSTLTLHDKNSAVDVETSVGRYDLFVGQAFEIVETSCGDCLPVYVQLHAIRQPSQP